MQLSYITWDDLIRTLVQGININLNITNELGVKLETTIQLVNCSTHNVTIECGSCFHPIVTFHGIQDSAGILSH